MKVLKIILFIIAVLILLVVILGFLGPKDYDVNRSVIIDAPKEIVYKEVSDLSNMLEWDAWKAKDPTMQVTIHGPGDEVGSYRRWESEESGIGEQKLVNLVPNERVDSELRFIEPFEDKASGYSLVKDAEGGTELTLGFKGENKFMSRVMAMVGMDMESMVGPMFEQEVNNIKAIAERKAGEQATSMTNIKDSKYSFGIQQRPALSFVLKRDVVKLENMKDFYSSHLPAIYNAVGASGAAPSGMPCGIYYSWDEENGETDMCAAVPVATADIRIEGYETVTLPAGRVAKVAYYGDYEGIGEAHYAMDDYLKANGLEQNGPVIEQYVTDPGAEPDTSKWLTDIFYHVK
ncbi:MAG: hypothetical protein HKN45_02415 [Flavobacteriales bacterium]|nr:hypothetical protein [Flavobacteriales bacterium]